MSSPPATASGSANARRTTPTPSQWSASSISVCAAPGAATVAAVATTFQGDVFCFDREFRVAAAVG